ncbi:hypothetical protein [Mesorhizobium kowhaii]|nr:hypothetical protein [Mesorhizobium kowhaii]
MHKNKRLKAARDHLESQRRTIFLFERRINPKKRFARFGPMLWVRRRR